MTKYIKNMIKQITFELKEAEYELYMKIENNITVPLKMEIGL